MDVGPSTYALVGDTKAELKAVLRGAYSEMEREEESFRGNRTGRGEPITLKIIMRTEQSRREKRRNGSIQIIIKRQKVR